MKSRALGISLITAVVGLVSSVYLIAQEVGISAPLLSQSRNEPPEPQPLSKGGEPKASGSVLFTVKDFETGFSIPAIISVYLGDSSKPIISLSTDENGRAVFSAPAATEYEFEIEARAGNYRILRTHYATEVDTTLTPEVLLAPIKSVFKRDPTKSLTTSSNENEAVIQGFIGNTTDWKPLNGVTVHAVASGVTVTTDNGGFFSFHVPALDNSDPHWIPPSELSR